MPSFAGNASVRPVLTTAAVRGVCTVLEQTSVAHSLACFPDNFDKTPASVIGAPVPPELVNDARLSPFHSSVCPNIPVADLVIRICKRGGLNAAVALYACVLFRRAGPALPECDNTAHVMHRLITACLNVAHKLLWDVSYSAKNFGKIAGLHPVEVVRCEAALAKLCDWRLNVSAGEIVDIVHWSQTQLPPPELPQLPIALSATEPPTPKRAAEMSSPKSTTASFVMTGGDSILSPSGSSEIIVSSSNGGEPAATTTTTPSMAGAPARALLRRNDS